MGLETNKELAKLSTLSADAVMEMTELSLITNFLKIDFFFSKHLKKNRITSVPSSKRNMKLY